MIENAIAGSAAMWNKCDKMIVRGQLPYNAEPPPSVLARSEITAVDAFYAAITARFPTSPAEQWTLTVDGLVNNATDRYL